MLGACLAPWAGSARAQEHVRLVPVRGLDELIPVPPDNPGTRASVVLGRRLFFDPRLSRDGRVSCASCHQPSHAFADTVPRSRGAAGRLGGRNAPAIVNRAYGLSFFWDGRATTLELQLLQPIQDSREMDLPLDTLIVRLKADPSVRWAFIAAFPDGVNATNVARALAAYVRTVRSGDSRYDRYGDGDAAALSGAERRGSQLFFGKANCSTCHLGANLTDEQFHNTGISEGTPDPGRSAVTGRDADRGAFKTPTLRDVASSAPYMHDGSLRTLESVVEFYDRGGRANPNLDREVRRLDLTAPEREDLVAFLRALSSPAPTCAPFSCVPD